MLLGKLLSMIVKSIILYNKLDLTPQSNQLKTFEGIYKGRWRKSQINSHLRPPPLTGVSSAENWLVDEKTELRYPITTA